MTIGQVAAAARVPVDTLRYYERVGLLAPPPRLPSGYRAYPEGTPKRVRFIKRAQALGFRLLEIKELLALRVEPDGTCAKVRAKTQAKIIEVEAKMAELDRIRAGLQSLVAACSAARPTSACPILDAFEQSTDLEPT